MSKGQNRFKSEPEGMEAPPTLQQRVALTQRPNSFALMYQRWSSLLFLHWEANAEALAATLPPGLYLDTFEGKAYLGLVPFYMDGVRPRFCPPVKGISDFLEMNLRTYVHDREGQAGVWFYSLDANQPLAVGLARRLFHLPYQHAEMRARREAEGWVRYSCRRAWTQVKMDFNYRGVGEVVTAQPGTLEFFLAERYLLYSFRNGELFSGRVYHAPYPLQRAELREWSDRILGLNGFDSVGRPPDLAHYSHGVEVEVFPLQQKRSSNKTSTS